MSTCWKCGRETPEGVTECAYGCNAGGVEEIKLALEAYFSDTVEVDIEHVVSEPENLVEFIAAILGNPPEPMAPDPEFALDFRLALLLQVYFKKTFHGFRVKKGSPLHQQLKDFIKP